MESSLPFGRHACEMPMGIFGSVGKTARLGYNYI